MKPRWTPWRAIKEFVGLVVIEPMREGRLQPRGWPPGFGAIAVATLIFYLGGAALILVAGPYRDTDRLIAIQGGVMPQSAMIFLSALLCWILTLGTAAIMHMHWSIRIVGWAVVSVCMLPYAVLGPANPLAPFLVFGAIGGIGVFILVRWRAQARWWEVVVCAALVTIAVQGAVTGIGAADQLHADLRPAVIYLSLALATVFAAPMYVLAGAALAQIAVTAAESAAALLRDDAPTKIWIGAVALMIGLRGAQVAFQFTSDWEFIEPRLFGTAVYIAAITLLVGLLWALGRHAPRRLGRPGDLVEQWGPWLYPIAVLVVGLLMITQFASAIDLVLGQFRVPNATLAAIAQLPGLIPGRFAGFRMLGAIVLLPLAFWSAYKGRMLSAMLLACFVVAVSIEWVMSISDLWLGYSLTVVAVVVSVLALAILVWLASKRSLTRVRVGGVMAALALSFVFPYRDALDEPLSAIVGFSGIAAIMFGLVWRILTDGAFTRADSKAFPRPSRVLIFFAGALIAVTGMAWDSLAGGRSALDGTGEAGLGDLLLGTPLFVTACITALMVAVWPPARTDAAEFPALPGPAPQVPGAYGPVARPHGQDPMSTPRPVGTFAPHQGRL